MMHIPLLSNMLGLGGAPTQPVVDGEAAVDFARVLGALPKQAVPVSGLVLDVAPQIAPAPLLAVAPEVAPMAAPALANNAVPVFELSPLAILAPALDPAKFAAPGKPAPASGKILPGAPKIAEAEPAPAQIADFLPGLPALGLADETKSDSLPIEEPSEAASWLALAQPAAPDAAMLQSPTAPEVKPVAAAIAAATAPAPERQLASAVALALPQAQLRQEKARATQATSTVTAPGASASAPAAEFSLPLLRSAHERMNAPMRLAENVAPTSQVVTVMAEAANPAAEMTSSAPTIEQPAMPEIELATVIDRLVQTRIQSREGRSEVNVPHPDFGRVTLTLSLAEQDRLGVSMPDAPPELRAAMGQAFAPPQRSEQSFAFNASDPSLSGYSDARREAGSSPGNPQHRADNQRGEQARQDTATGRKGQHPTQSDERRNAQGRGVLA